MIVDIPRGIFTYVADTGVEVRYTGPDDIVQVRIDDQGAVVLPAVVPEEQERDPWWSIVPGLVPTTREGEPFVLDDPEQWPSPFILVDGKWAFPGLQQRGPSRITVQGAENG